MDTKKMVRCAFAILFIGFGLAGCPQVAVQYDQSSDQLSATMRWDSHLTSQQLFNGVTADFSRVGLAYLINETTVGKIDWAGSVSSPLSISMVKARQAFGYPDRLWVVPVAEQIDRQTVYGNMSLWTATLLGQIAGANGLAANGQYWEISVPYRALPTPTSFQTFNWPDVETNSITGNNGCVLAMGAYFVPSGGRHGFIQAFERAQNGALNPTDDYCCDGLFQYCSPLALAGNKLYTVYGNSGLSRTILEFEISDPRNLPEPRSVVQVPMGVFDLAVNNGVLWVSGGDAGCCAVDLNSGNIVSTLPQYAEGLAAQGNVLYLCGHDGGLIVYDISNASQPKEVARLREANPYAVDVAVKNNIACALWNDGHVVTYDINEPLNPIKLGFYDHAGSCWSTSIQLVGFQAVVSLNNVDSMNHFAGVDILDIVNPTTPKLASSERNLMNDRRGCVIGTKLYSTKQQKLVVEALL
jgi:hypothetical protein